MTTYGYDPAGRLASTDYSDTTPDVIRAHDRLGRQTLGSNGVATTSYAYDHATLALDTETISYDLDHDGSPDFTRDLDHDGSPDFTRDLDRKPTDLGRKPTDLGRDTGWQLKDGETIENEATYTYSPTTGRLATVRSGDVSSPQTFTYSYLPNSTLIATVTGPIHTMENTWEPTRDVLTLKQNKVGETLISSYDYTVNALGQRTTVSQTGTAFAAARGIVWGYDALGQVTKADHDADNTHDRAYHYDAIGNRIEARDGVTTVTGTANYTANALNQYSSIVDPQSTILNPSYDDDGNQIDAQVLPLGSSSLESCVFSWDAENRLVSTTVDGTTTTYLYDAQSRRIAKTTGSDTTLFVYDGWNVIAEYSSPNLQSPISLVRSYLWGLDLSGTMQGAGGVGGLLALQIHNPQSSIYYPLFDGNGNVSEYLDSTGTLAAHFEYDPFGNSVINSDVAGMFPYRFSTKPQDAETGLYYYGYRYYDPITGRWSTRDPIGERGGLNLYAMVSNELVSRIDFLGYYHWDPHNPPRIHPPNIEPPGNDGDQEIIPPPPDLPRNPDAPKMWQCNCAKKAKCTPIVRLEEGFVPCEENDCPTVTAKGAGGAFFVWGDAVADAQNKAWDDGDAKCGKECTFGELIDAFNDCVCVGN